VGTPCIYNSYSCNTFRSATRLKLDLVTEARRWGNLSTAFKCKYNLCDFCVTAQRFVSPDRDFRMTKGSDHNKQAIVSRLNALLSAYQVAYFNTRASHWMIKGENFFELHKVFETAYNDATEKIDEIAERILTLGGIPLMTVSEIIASSEIGERKVSGDQTACIKGMLDDLTQLTVIENEIVKMAAGADDVVTADILTKYLGQQQKTAWMLYQFLNKKSAIK
jgi:starvation-inducible DNA-binding protein